jgi:LPS-assembly protein
MRFSLRNNLVWLLATIFGSAGALAADEISAEILPPLAADPALLQPLPEPDLRATTGMVPPLRDENENYPSFISAERLHGIQDVETVAEGAAEMRTLGRSLSADRLTYWPEQDEVEATGNVHLLRDQDVMAGPKMRLKLEANIGYFDHPEYSITRLPKDPAMQQMSRPPMTGSGRAEKMDFEGEGLYRLKNATYTTCKPSRPDWFAEVDEMSLDYNSEVAKATNARLKFAGVPILYSPWMSFSLNNQRKTGLLTPTIGSTSQTGLEYTQPFYWNIAPNADATIAPRFMQRRGTQWNTELRYLGREYSGEVHHEYLPHDKIFNDRRYALSLVHNQHIAYGLTGSLNFNGVSDDKYFSDLSTRASIVSQANLLRQGSLNYGGGWWNANITAQHYQTLQDPTLPAVVVPYARLPQATFSAARPDLPLGIAGSFNAEYVAFDHPTLVTGQRWVAYPQLSLPLQTAAFSFTPKLGVHLTRYSLLNQPTGTPQYISRGVPIGSIDTAVTLERPADLFGRSLTQTLEPRLFYVRIPNRRQDQAPIFDTAAAAFNATQLFTENRYSGSDRIGDAQQMTAMVTSRFIDAETGSELVRGAVGQRYYFRDQTVTLPGEVPRAGNTSDILALASGRLTKQVSADVGWQYNPHDRRTETLNVGGRYQPGPGKVVNASYRYTRDQLAQVDVSAQWPIGGGWHGVGRYNYSTKESRVIESLGGLEYDGGCWVFRAVGQRVATVASSSNTAIFVQLELNGFSRIGSNPLDLLKRNIPGYGVINRSTADPAFAAN